MTNRYEFTGAKRDYFGHTLQEIRATIDLPEFEVSAGDCGGWIESADSFPQSSKGWIYAAAIVLHGGNIRGGNIHGGDIRGGNIWGGDIHGGNIWGGNIWGGNIHGGNIRGGNIRGGDIRGGDTLAIQPVFLAGLRWPVTITDSHMAIGCQHHTLKKWWKFSDALIARMDSGALKFWQAHKPMLQALCAASDRESGL